MMYVSINSLTSHRKALLGLSGCSTIQQATTKVSIGLGCKAGLLVTLIYCNVGVQLPRGAGASAGGARGHFRNFSFVVWFLFASNVLTFLFALREPPGTLLISE
ncbi:hypothetical protein JYU34_001914 [Plutella xylostella]|uniref:Uncharacterized protein n=1 Tax=Plutella xylostella TaxID=51655 RepID=A0ABQ7R534_PLUXY|nr:hypothetical protein JYU34_001914 [Plutella xylostella]